MLAKTRPDHTVVTRPSRLDEPGPITFRPQPSGKNVVERPPDAEPARGARKVLGEPVVTSLLEPFANGAAVEIAADDHRIGTERRIVEDDPHLLVPLVAAD